VIASWAQHEDRPGAEALLGLTDELDRIRRRFHSLQSQRAALPADGDDRKLVDDALALMAVALHEVSAALRQNRPPVGIDSLAGQLANISDQLGNSDTAAPAVRFCGARIAATAGQLRAVNRMVTELSGVRRMALPVAAAQTADAIIVLPSGLASVFRQVRAAMSPSSPAFRHAVRLAVVIPLATEISALLPWPRAYWLPVTAAIVLKPDFTATVSRGVARTIGTFVGVLAAAAIVATAHPQGGLLIVLIAACTWLSYTVFAANYAVYAVFLTSLVILLVSPGQRSPVSTIENRAIDTLIGGAIAIAAYVIWPTWEARTLQVTTADRFESLRRYLTPVLRAYLDPQAFDTAALARLAASTRRAQSAVTASLERARGEPARGRPDIERYSGILAAGRRIVAGTHALASHMADSKRQIAVAAAATIAAEIDDSMRMLVEAITSGTQPGPLPELRRSQQQLTAATQPGLTPADRRGAILAALLDPVVDSINSAADLLGFDAADSLPPTS
jgi:uncharacterized membrane protein YccC